MAVVQQHMFASIFSVAIGPPREHIGTRTPHRRHGGNIGRILDVSSDERRRAVDVAGTAIVSATKYLVLVFDRHPEPFDDSRFLFPDNRIGDAV
jgi:hypothetical protein